ncbi:MAG: TM2 domain-containing protein, partial [Acidobacteriota bacterium]|nr:TM2 domain-containing protein [Acidobacteriota bacterium]
MNDTKISSEKKLTLLLLWLLVGIFGVHRFYIGKSISGMIQVLNFGLMIL